ncbi:hypothetical protein [Microbacterium soli]|uniref:hypothetical protein n=1 Tax=Microbacterium soli TaxID=446075 RepID=UPI0031E160BE
MEIEGNVVTATSEGPTLEDVLDCADTLAVDPSDLIGLLARLWRAKRELVSQHAEVEDLTDKQLDGLACIRCGNHALPMIPAGFGPRGQLFKCAGHSCPYDWCENMHDRVFGTETHTKEFVRGAVRFDFVLDEHPDAKARTYINWTDMFEMEFTPDNLDDLNTLAADIIVGKAAFEQFVEEVSK